MIKNKIELALLEVDFDTLSEGAISKRARSFLGLINSIIALSSDKLIKLATGRQTGLANEARNYKFLVEQATPGQVETVAMGNNYRAVSILAGGKEYNFIVPKDKDYTDVDVKNSLLDLLKKMKVAKKEGNTSALKSYDSLLYKSKEDLQTALKNKEQLRGGQVKRQDNITNVSNIKKIITPIVVQMSGKDGPIAASMMENISDEEISKAVTAHTWTQEAITEYARIAWTAVSDKINSINDGGRVVVNSLAQTAVAYITFKYLHIKAQQLKIKNERDKLIGQKNQDAFKTRMEQEKMESNKEKEAREAQLKSREQKRADELHALELKKKQADIEKVRAQAEATAKRPI